MDDPFRLQRFVDAQNPVFDQVRGELRRGRKSSHWMWFVFPQISGLGHSRLAAEFAISSRQEAEAYLNHPCLLMQPKTIRSSTMPCASSSTAIMTPRL